MSACFKDALKANVSAILSDLSQEQLEDLVDFLIAEGVKKEVDLFRMTIPILKTKLTTVDASDLFEVWQQKYGAGSSGNRQQSSHPLQQSTSGNGKLKEVPLYDRDHILMPTGIQEAIDKKCRPLAKIREAMVERFVDDGRKNVHNLSRNSFNELADFLAESYPETFRDTVIYTNNKKGSDSLRDQFRNKFDNDKRAPNLTAKEVEAPCRMEAYGCVSWNPPLPNGDTEERQEEKRVTLQNMNRLAKKNWDLKIIKKLMGETYYLQRKDINGAVVTEKPKSKSSKKRKRKEMEEEESVDEPAAAGGMKVTEVRERWPFLFVSKWMNQHCKELTGVDFNTCFYEWSKSDAEILIEFLALKSEDMACLRRKMVREERKGNPAAKLPTVLLMLVKHFSENLDALTTFTEKTSEIEDLEESLFSSEGFPNLIVAGEDLFNAENIFYCCDHIALASSESFLEAFVMFFCSYFVLNVLYATQLACTLIFLQEQVLKVQSGNMQKCATMEIQRAAYRKVLRLSNKYQTFQDKWNEEERKEN